MEEKRGQEESVREEEEERKGLRKVGMKVGKAGVQSEHHGCPKPHPLF